MVYGTITWIAVNAVSSYRSELEAILEQRDVKAPEVTQWCDNETAVTRINAPPSNHDIPWKQMQT